MPTYEYLCQECSHRFETWQKMTDEPLTDCPECGSHIRRVFYPAGLVFKGSGFYKTDHGNGVLPAANNHSSSDGAGESKATSESKASENGTGAKASQNGTSAKASESSTSTAGVK